MDQSEGGNEPSGAPVAAGICGQLHGGAIYNCYNIGETKIITTRTVGLRNGSIVGYIDNFEIKNCYCWCSEKAKSVAEKKTSSITYEIHEETQKENLKNIASQLGEDYKEDTTGINQGYPILTWQKEEQKEGQNQE